MMEKPTPKLVWDFLVPVVLTFLIAAIIVITLRIDSEFSRAAVLSRRAACSAVYDGNEATFRYLHDTFASDPKNKDFLDGLSQAYEGNLRECLIKANSAPRP